MFSSYLLSLREGLEAALILGVVLGALRKTNRQELSHLVWFGALSAAVISILVAIVLALVNASLEGRAEEVFEGITMLVAAVVLTWMIFWMRNQARNIQTTLEADVQQAASQTGGKALFLLAFFAVFREGVELSLFLTAASFASGAQAVILGASLGLASVVVLAWFLFKSLIRLNLGQFFAVTSILLMLFAAGLVAHGVHELNEAGWIPAVVEHIWDINHILDETSVTGGLLRSLFGYNGNPSLTEMLAYVGYFVIILIGVQIQRQRVSPAIS